MHRKANGATTKKEGLCISKLKTYIKTTTENVCGERVDTERQAPHQTKINYWCNIMKLTQKWVNGSCDNYDQNSDKKMKAGVAKQQRRLHTHTHKDTRSHPQKKSERNNIKSKKKKKGWRNCKSNQMCDNTQKQQQQKNNKKNAENGWRIFKWSNCYSSRWLISQISTTAWVVAGQTRQALPPLAQVHTHAQRFYSHKHLLWCRRFSLLHGLVEENWTSTYAIYNNNWGH